MLVGRPLEIIEHFIVLEFALVKCACIQLSSVLNIILSIPVFCILALKHDKTIKEFVILVQKAV